jgi:hypothetical protein
MDGWIDGGMDGKAVLRTAYSKQKVFISENSGRYSTVFLCVVKIICSWKFKNVLFVGVDTKMIFVTQFSLTLCQT